MDGKLVFGAPHDGSGRLVFGEQGAEVVPDATFGIDADLPGLGALTLRAGAGLSIDADLPGLDGTLGLLWDANVSRGGLRAELGTHWQHAKPLACGLGAAWQQGMPLRTAAAARWQPAQPRRAGLLAAWQATELLRSAVRSHWQQGAPRRAGIDVHWQESERLRAAVGIRWQQGEQRRAAVLSHWQEMLRLRAAVRGHWQQGTPLRAVAGSRWGAAIPVHIHLRTHWQEAMRPPAGVAPAPEPPEPRPPCYDPATVGRLVFTDMALGDGRLVFRCEGHGPNPQPGATVVVPIRGAYMVLNDVNLMRVDGAPIPAYTFGMSLNADSWTWQWSATLHASALPLIRPNSNGDPVEIMASVNGVPYRLIVEDYSRQRQFGQVRIAVNGRGRAALLDAPHAPEQNHGNSVDRTAQQLALDVLTMNGVGIGWDVDWQLTDWLMPGGVWTHQGSYISAILDIARAAGGYVQPHDTAPTLRVLPRYPVAYWHWHTLTPDFELPSAVVSVEGIEWQQRAAYDRVYVSGANSAGVLGEVTRGGTAGALAAPMVTHPLITHADAARQRGIAELSDTGYQAHVSLRAPVLPETGVIKPGALVRYVDAGETYLGLVRGLSLDWSRPVLRQTLSVETHPA